MQSSYKYKNLIFFILFIFLFFYLFLNTGIHGDDFALIEELRNKNSLYSIHPNDLGKYIYNLPSYFIWTSYVFIGYENLIIYDLLKFFLNFISFLFLYYFFRTYFSDLRSILISFIIILYPTHDSSNYWLMATPLYIFFPTMIFFSYTLINKNFYILGSMLLLIASFNYTSPPYIVGLSILFLLEKKYKNFLIFLCIGSIYVFYYFLISKYFINLEHRVDDNLNFIKILINFFTQLVSSIDTNIGISFIIKIFYSLTYFNFKNIILILFILIFFNFYLKIDNEDQINNYKLLEKKNLLISFFFIYIISLFVFSLTSSYPQTTFNLGNRITIYSSYFFVILILFLVNRKYIYIILLVFSISSILGISEHWKDFNKQNKILINNIYPNDELEQIKSEDIILLKGNLYSKFGPISHIDFLIVPWVGSKLFNQHYDFKTIPFSKYLYFNEGSIKNIKENSKYSIDGSIYIYDTNTNGLTLIKNIYELNEIIEKEPFIMRHWIQMKEFSFISKIVIKFIPRLSYLFIR